MLRRLVCALVLPALAAQDSRPATVPRPGKLDYEQLCKELDPGPQALLSRDFPANVRKWIDERTTDEDRQLVAHPELAGERAIGELSRRIGSQTSYLACWYECAKWVVLLDDLLDRRELRTAAQFKLWFSLYRLIEEVTRESRTREKLGGAIDAIADEGPRAFAETVRELRLHGERTTNACLVRVSVELLRSECATPLRCAVLAGLAAVLSDNEDLERSLSVLEECARLEGAKTTDSSWRKLGIAYAMTLHVPEARACLQRVKAGASGESAQELARAQRCVDVAQRIVDSRAAGSFDGQIAAAHGLLDLGQWKAARAEFRRLCGERGEDARPHVGLARVSYEELDDATARGDLDRANGREPKDLRHHSLALCLGLAELPFEIARMRANGSSDAAALELARERVVALRELLAKTSAAGDLHTQHARVLVEMLDAGLAKEDGDAATMLTRAFLGRRAQLREFLQRYPGEAVLEDLLRGYALLAKEWSDAADVLSGLRPCSDTAWAWLALAVRFERSDLAARVEGSLSPADQRTGAEWHTLGVAHALSARLSNAKAEWQIARTCLERARSLAPNQTDPRLESDLGVVLFELGEIAMARATFAKALAVGEYPALRAHAAFVAADSVRDAISRTLAAVDASPSEADGPTLEAVMHGWASALAAAAGDQEAATREAKEALELAGDRPLDRGLGKAGAVVHRGFIWGFGTSRTRGREIWARIDMDVCLTFAPKTPLAELRRRALR